MFLGHFAFAFAAKRAAPEASLGTLFLGAQLPDAIFPVLVLAGVEAVRLVPGSDAVVPLELRYPWSHSLVGVAVQALVLAVAYRALRSSTRAAAWLAAAVASHWVLDVVSHRPDVPVLPAGPYLGLGLWDSRTATVLVEGAIFAAAVVAYARSTEPRGRAGRASLAAFVGLLLLIYAGFVWGPPPETGEVMAWTSLAGWLLIAAGYGLERVRPAASRRGRVR